MHVSFAVLQKLHMPLVSEVHRLWILALAPAQINMQPHMSAATARLVHVRTCSTFCVRHQAGACTCTKHKFAKMITDLCAQHPRRSPDRHKHPLPALPPAGKFLPFVEQRIQDNVAQRPPQK
jgi:hypothetical protein